MSGFERLHTSIQHHIVNALEWPALRPLQEAAVDPIMDGTHCLLLARTAGGKTEAAMFPVLSRIGVERWRPMSVLYLCPLRALLNNLQPRLERYGGFTGHRVALWHGDVGPAERRRLVAEPPDVLLTTPESLEAMLMSTQVDNAWFFGNLRAAIVDEVHSFAGDDRGWHLRAVLERLQQLADRPFQRIGMSATVGNPDGLLAWLAPGQDTPRVVVAPDGIASLEADVEVDYVGSVANAATVISQLHRGEKRLVFAETRMGAERLTRELRARDVTTFVIHSALGRDERRRTEEAFAQGSNCVIVATSALELGIDVGDLDRVIQVDAPSSVSSFLQRLGRSGRRDRTTANTLFLATDEESLWTSCGITRLWEDGYVEPVVAPPLPAHLLAHQLLALVLQEGSVGQRLWLEWLGHPCALGDVELLSDAVADHLTGSGYLAVDQGMLSIGREAEASFGRRNFLELTSVFTSPPVFTVLAGRREIGYVHDIGISAAFQAKGGPPVLLLAGRGWRILEVDWRRRRVYVELVQLDGRTGYHGFTAPMSYALAQSIGAVLGGESPGGQLTKRASSQLDEDRRSFPGLRADEATAVRRFPDGRSEWWTFGGMRANLELAARLGSLCRSAASIDSLAIGLVDDTTADDVREGLDRQTPVADLLELAEEASEGLKFGECIPDWLADSIVLARISDEEAVGATLARSINSAFLS